MKRPRRIVRALDPGVNKIKGAYWYGERCEQQIAERVATYVKPKKRRKRKK